MTSQQKNNAAKYLSKVKGYSRITNKNTRDAILRKVEEDIISFSEDSEEFTYDDLVDLFGTPEEVVAEHLRNQDAASLCRTLSMKHCVTAACFVVAFAAVLTGGIKTYLNYRLYADVKDSMIASYEITTTIEETNTYEEN